jgi:hypothetical protein
VTVRAAYYYKTLFLRGHIRVLAIHLQTNNNFNPMTPATIDAVQTIDRSQSNFFRNDVMYDGADILRGIRLDPVFLRVTIRSTPG